ncbi:hypothetical protein BRC90_00875 [Halobacteriales archaeon QS_4_69_34]|nr:MAG: hypothetical protein BRC90_00875 [Halobacteriales archaeon QS_4_69_34]
MELTRRDALAALAGGTTLVGTGAAVVGRGPADPGRDGSAGSAAGNGEKADPGNRPIRFDEEELEALVAVAQVLYPSKVAGVREFVETYAAGRFERRSGASPTAGVREALQTLDERAREWEGEGYAALDPDARERVLAQMGANTAESDPRGTDAERVRHGVVDELLYALYASPAGGRLLGIENPPGWPGGLDAYRRGPDGRLPERWRSTDGRAPTGRRGGR